MDEQSRDNPACSVYFPFVALSWRSQGFGWRVLIDVSLPLHKMVTLETLPRFK